MNVPDLVKAIAVNHGFNLGTPGTALLVSPTNNEGEYRRGELLIAVWNDRSRFSVGRMVFGDGQRKRPGFTIWFNADWLPMSAVNDFGEQIFGLELATLEMTELIETIYLLSNQAMFWQE